MTDGLLQSGNDSGQIRSRSLLLKLDILNVQIFGDDSLQSGNDFGQCRVKVTVTKRSNALMIRDTALKFCVRTLCNAMIIFSMSLQGHFTMNRTFKIVNHIDFKLRI